MFDNSCTDACAEGYYCPEKSISKYQNQCGVVTKVSYELVTKILTSYQIYPIINYGYSLNEISNNNYVFNQIIKEFLINTIKFPFTTPFGEINPLIISKQSNFTDYYMISLGINGTDSTIYLKNSNAVFCPLGSRKPLIVLKGYYSLNNNRTTRSNQLTCLEGTYCKNGIAYDCPAGTYGNTKGSNIYRSIILIL